VLNHIVEQNRCSGVGIDIDRAALDRGRRLHSSLTLIPGNGLCTPFRDNSFDLILCTEVLEHVRQPDLLLAELQRLARKYVLLSAPNEPFFRAANFLRGKHWKRLGNDPEHLFNWTARQFLSLVRDRFEIVEVSHPFPWTMVLARKGGSVC
jgi:ubiquinone/menaquinone biosynthesis C-methylase UbiE